MKLERQKTIAVSRWSIQRYLSGLNSNYFIGAGSLRWNQDEYSLFSRCSLLDAHSLGYVIVARFFVFDGKDFSSAAMTRLSRPGMQALVLQTRLFR